MLLAMVSASQSVGAWNLRQLRRQFSETARKASDIRVKLSHIKKEEKTAVVRLRESEHRLHATQSALVDVRTQLDSTRHQLSKTKSELDAIERSLKDRNDKLASRLISNYRLGNSGYLSVVLGSADFTDLLNRGHIVRKFVDTDVDLINGFKRDKEAAQEHKTALEFQEKKRADLEHQQSILTHQAFVEKIERAQTLQEVSQERAKYEQMLAELEKNSQQIEAMIRRMEQTPQGRKRLAQAWHGNFSLPVNGSISSGFGMRFHPVIHRYKLHTGVDIRCPIGTPIHAAGNGVVIYAGWYGAYGNCVIIDHGGGVTTLYGHQSRVAVGVGASVSKGQVIGYSGSTGWSTGPHCHFEKRVHGTPVNPL